LEYSRALTKRGAVRPIVKGPIEINLLIYEILIGIPTNYILNNIL